MPVPALAFDTFRVWVSADGFVPKVMDWKPYELQDPFTSYTTRLDPGVTLAGVVQDEQGAPVAGAKIGFTGRGWTPPSVRTSRSTPVRQSFTVTPRAIS